jgi:hypothetical protein
MLSEIQVLHSSCFWKVTKWPPPCLHWFKSLQVASCSRRLQHHHFACTEKNRSLANILHPTHTHARANFSFSFSLSSRRRESKWQVRSKSLRGKQVAHYGGILDLMPHA